MNAARRLSKLADALRVLLTPSDPAQPEEVARDRARAIFALSIARDLLDHEAYGVPEELRIVAVQALAENDPELYAECEGFMVDHYLSADAPASPAHVPAGSPLPNVDPSVVDFDPSKGIPMRVTVDGSVTHDTTTAGATAAGATAAAFPPVPLARVAIPSASIAPEAPPSTPARAPINGEIIGDADAVAIVEAARSAVGPRASA